MPGAAGKITTAVLIGCKYLFTDLLLNRRKDVVDYRVTKFLVKSGCLFFFLVGGTGCYQGEPIKLGFAGSLSGARSIQGVSNPLAETDDYFFMVTNTNQFETTAPAHYDSRRMGLRKIAALIDMTYPSFTVDWHDSFKTNSKNRG